MSERLDTSGHLPVVEYRSHVDRYFITYPSLQVELAPAFSHKFTAQEIAINAYYGVPFFMMIPTVPYDTAYPRPGLLMPKIGPIDIQLRIR
jgi:hypothetical protein